MAELTPFGFERRSRIEILEDIYQRLRDLFGPAILLTEDSVMGKFASILAEQQLENERLAEEVYESRKVTSAEGIYLDDILNRYGVYRRGPIASSGRASVVYQATVSDLVEITSTGNFSANNGKVYKPTETVNLFNAFTGLTINTSEVNVVTYTAQIVNETTQDVVNFSHTVAGNSVLARTNFLEALATFINDNTTGNTSLIFTESDGATGVNLFVGFSSSEEYAGLTTPVTFNMSPRIGTWRSEVSVVATEEGYSPLGIAGITGYTPSFTGLLAATNGRPFSSGSNSETDAEYFQRWSTTPSQAPFGTRDGVVISLLSVDGVSKVKIYDNPGIADTAEADGLTFRAIVVGGTDEDVARAIYLSKPINAGTSGSITEVVDTVDGASETIKFGRAVETPLSIRITYSPRNNIPLNSLEQQSVKDSLIELINDNAIGETITNPDLEAEVYSSLSNRRLKSLLVEVKGESEDESEYTTADLILGLDAIATLDPADIEFDGSL